MGHNIIKQAHISAIHYIIMPYKIIIIIYYPYHIQFTKDIATFNKPAKSLLLRLTYTINRQ